MPSILVPVNPLPELVHAGRSVHGELSRQAWMIEGLWGLHLYRYRAELTVAGQRVQIEPGHAGFTPPGALAEYRFEGRSVHVFAHLRFPTDSELGEAPLIFPLHGAFAPLWTQFEEAVGLLSASPRRAEVKVWDVWLGVLEAANSSGAKLPEAVRKGMDLIERHLHEELTVQAIARDLALSHNHFTRLFRSATGQTVIEAIQARRMDRARHLLLRTTMPVKEVASSVGIHDLQRFNKSVRKAFGLSPRGIRQGARSAAEP